MKQKSMRKVLSLALAIAMLLTMLPPAAFAEEAPLVGEIASSETIEEMAVAEDMKETEMAEAPASEGTAVLAAENEAELYASTSRLHRRDWGIKTFPQRSIFTATCCPRLPKRLQKRLAKWSMPVE